MVNTWQVPTSADGESRIAPERGTSGGLFSACPEGHCLGDMASVLAVCRPRISVGTKCPPYPFLQFGSPKWGSSFMPI
jgi:hypothetical protein